MIRKILFLASNPTDTTRLRLDKEVREIAEGLKRSNERDKFDLISKFAVRVEDLRRGILDHSPWIIHFSGHGEGADGIVLENDQGEATQVPNDALAELFELSATHAECVILNACYSDVQADAIAQHIPYVVGMKSSVSDDAALEFAVAFYDALGAGKSIEAAFRFGRNAIALKGIPEHLTPVLRIREPTEAERQRLESSYSPLNDVFVDLSVVNDDAASRSHSANVTLGYSVRRNERRIAIDASLNYLTSFRAGGPIAPLNYLSPGLCPFRWDFPVLDFKILNGRLDTLFLTEVVFDIEESRPDQAPLLSIKRDTQQRHAGDLLLVNEGWCDLIDLTISFQLLPGEIAAPSNCDPPYRHEINVPRLADYADVDVTQAFQREGVDIENLVLLTNGKWESQEAFVAPTADGSEVRMTAAEMQERVKRCLGSFQDYVGTLAGEISFATDGNAEQRYSVRFHAPVYLANANRLGIPRPPTYAYDTAFDVKNTTYQRRVQIAHELQQGQTDRFTIKVGVAQSSTHRFRATVRDITGLELRSLPIELNCFVPRSRGSAVARAISSPDVKR